MLHSFMNTINNVGGGRARLNIELYMNILCYDQADGHDTVCRPLLLNDIQNLKRYPLPTLNHYFE